MLRYCILFLFLLFTDVLSALSGSKPTYYLVRRDYRKCISPICGGYWLKALNARKTKCADGSIAEECYVAAFRFSKDSTLSEEEQIQFSNEVGDGDIVLGTFIPDAYRDLGFENIADFLVESGWLLFEGKLN